MFVFCCCLVGVFLCGFFFFLGGGCCVFVVVLCVVLFLFGFCCCCWVCGCGFFVCFFLGGGAEGGRVKGLKSIFKSPEPLPEFLPTGPLPSRNPSWPTQSGITESQARRRCRMEIHSAQLFAHCRHMTSLIEDVKEDCVADILVSRAGNAYGTAYFALSMINHVLISSLFPWIPAKVYSSVD